MLPASRAAHRKELAHRERMRLEQIEGKVDRGLAMGREGASAPSCPTFTDGDIEEVGKLLVAGRIRLPSHVRITVITTVEEVRSKIFGSTEVFAHAADQLHAHQLRPMFILDALEYGVLSKLGGSWVWRADVYKRLAPTDPRLI
jgi:hypothetical protein